MKNFKVKQINGAFGEKKALVQKEKFIVLTKIK
jgi:hypothetical protein